MKFRMPGLPVIALSAALCLCFVPAKAQTKPPESASKVKKVLLYNKFAGWDNNYGREEVKAAFASIAAAKGFELEQSDSDTGITLEFLKQFQVIVWNNNTNGAPSVPMARARQAVLDYVDQGGGWMLICLAGDHNGTWPELAERMGTVFTTHASMGSGEVVLDKAARVHGELQWMVQDLPDVFGLDDMWLSFQNTVRPLPGMTVVATSRGARQIVTPTADKSGDNVYIWAREVGQGRLLYNAIGYGGRKVMEQQDGVVPRMYWENLRYAAGDYQNGCTTPVSPGFDAAARVHIEAMCSPTGITAKPIASPRVVSQGGRRVRLTRAPASPFTIRVRDIRGVNVWERTLPAGTGEIALNDALKPGVYLFEVLGPGPAIRQRLLLP